MVTRGKNHDAREFDHAVVQRGNAFHIQMVGRLVEQQHVCPGDHHLGKHAAHLFPSGKHLQFFHAVIARKQHSSQETAHIGGVLDLGILGEPVGDRQVTVKFLRIIFRKICT